MMEKLLGYYEFLNLDEGISSAYKKIFKIAGGVILSLLALFGISLAVVYNKNKRVMSEMQSIINRYFSTAEMIFIKKTLERDAVMIKLNNELYHLADEYENAVNSNMPPVMLHDISKKNKIILDAIQYRKLQIFGPDVVNRMNIVERELKEFLDKNNIG